MTKEIKDKIRALEDALNKDPKSKTFALLADYYRQLGEYEKAIEICDNGLVEHPNFLNAFMVLGKIYFDQKNYEMAMENFN